MLLLHQLRLRFQKDLFKNHVFTKLKSRVFFKFLLFEMSFRFCVGLVQTVGLTIEI